jgi:BTB/POZ domain
MMSMVQVIVGPDQTPWNMHRALLSVSSHTALLALGLSSEKPSVSMIDWSHLHADEFDIFGTFLYTGQLRNILGLPMNQLFQLYVLGETLQSSAFQHEVFAAIFTQLRDGNTVLKEDQVNYVMKYTLRQSALRSFCLDLFGIWLYRGQARFKSGEIAHEKKTILIDPDLKGDCMDGVLKAISALKGGRQKISLSFQDYFPYTATPRWPLMQLPGSAREEVVHHMTQNLELGTDSRSDHCYSASFPRRYVLLGYQRLLTKQYSIRGMMEVVRVQVGSGDKAWQIHRLLLTRESMVAQTALSSSFKESEVQSITWPEFDDKNFDIFVKYLYTGDVATGYLSCDQLLRLFVLADQLISSSFMLIVFRAIFDRLRSTEVLTTRQISYIMSHTHANSCLQRFCTDLVGFGLMNGIYGFADEPTAPRTKILAGELKSDFMSGVLCALRSGRRNFRDLQRPLEYYWTDTSFEASDSEGDPVAVPTPNQDEVQRLEEELNETNA